MDFAPFCCIVLLSHLCLEQIVEERWESGNDTGMTVYNKCCDKVHKIFGWIYKDY